jgi:hypothetical protein
MNPVHCLAAALAVVIAGAGPAVAQDKGKKTLAYWKNVADIFEKEMDGVTDKSPVDKQLTAMRNLVRRINDLSARGVDEDAIEISEKMVKLFKRIGDYTNDYGDGDRAFKSGLRDGINKNPTRVIDEKKAIFKQRDETKEAATKTRKRLEARYDLDFPAIIW